MKWLSYSVNAIKTLFKLIKKITFIDFLPFVVLCFGKRNNNIYLANELRNIVARALRAQ